MKLQVRSRSSSAFTLVELIISSSLMVLILAGSYLCLRAGIDSRKLVESRADVAQSARVALAMIAADLRCAVPLSKEFEFVGMNRTLGDVEADNIDFGTHNYTPRAQRESDFCEISYFVNQDPDTDELSLWRRRDPTPDPEPLAGGQREEIATGLSGFRLEYYDGFEWFDEWGDPEGKRQGEPASLLQSNLSGLPEAVRITILFAAGSAKKADANPEHPLTFQTMVRLNLAAAAARTGSGSSPNPGNSDSTNSSPDLPPGGPN